MSTQRNTPKYAPPEPIDLPDRQWPSRTLTTSPEWCSVDLRDGNQALPNPLSPDQKLEYFQMLCEIGFKNIEVAFPSASQDDFDFTRRLTDEGHVPEGTFIMGLTQCRPHLIERTFESLAGAPRAIVHAYVAASRLHRDKVFNLSGAETIEMAVRSVKQIRELADAAGDSDIRFEFSPEEFTDTDLDFSLELCNAVFETWGKATPEKPLIFNLPATVERRPPNQYADMIEKFGREFPQRRSIRISVHGHNDQGMAVAASEMALLAGADRVEGALFGHGERSGNVDLVIVANNLFSRGIDTGLDFSNLQDIARRVETLTNMEIYYRQPYSGEYVFTAFSGSHQDAIRKGISRLEEAPETFGARWKVPYMHVDPVDLGREYKGLIRINSQSGKGGIAWVLETEFGLQTPKPMHPEIGRCVQQLSEHLGREVTSEEVHQAFGKEFMTPAGPYELVGYWPRPDDADPTTIHGEVRLRVNGQEKVATADGNGPVSAFVSAVRKLVPHEFNVEDYHEQAVGKGADARAMAYVPLELPDGRVYWGVGGDTNIDQAAVRAIMAGLNRLAIHETE